MAEVGTAFVSVLPSAKGFGRATEKQVGGEMASAGKSVGGKFGTAMKVGALAAVGGALAVGKFLGDAIDEAREAAKIGARTENVIEKMGNAAGVSAKEVGDLASAISLKTGVDDEAIQSGQNLLLTFGNLRNEAGEGNDIFDQTSQLMVDMSAAMGTDAKGSAIQLGKALNDPIKGLTALSRVGVSFTAQQEKQIKKLTESGELMSAQKIILGELERQFGGAAEAMATPADKVAVAWGNVKEQIGTALLPTVDRFLNFLSGQVFPALTEWWDRLAPARETIGKVAGGIQQILGFIRNAQWGRAWDVFSEAARKAFKAAVDLAKTFLTDRLIPAIVNALREAREAWANRWANFWKDPAKAYSRTESETESFGQRMVARMRGIGIDVGVALIGQLSKMPAAAAREGARTVGGLMQALRGAPGLAAAVALDVIGDLRRGLESGRQMAAAMGTNMINGLIDGIKWMASRAVDAAVGVVKGAIEAAKNLLGINSPSRVFRDIGMQTGRGYVEGLNGERRRALDATRRLISTPNIPRGGSLAGDAHAGRAIEVHNHYPLPEKPSTAVARMSNLPFLLGA